MSKLLKLTKPFLLVSALMIVSAFVVGCKGDTVDEPPAVQESGNGGRTPGGKTVPTDGVDN